MALRGLGWASLLGFTMFYCIAGTDFFTLLSKAAICSNTLAFSNVFHFPEDTILDTRYNLITTLKFPIRSFLHGGSGLELGPKGPN